MGLFAPRGRREITNKILININFGLAKAKFERDAHFSSHSLRSRGKMAKKLYRSQPDKIIAGVAGGLAEYFEVDPMIVRLLFILITIIGGSGVLIYIILWLLLPRDPNEPAIINEEKVKEFASEIKEKAQDLKEDWQNKRAEKEAVKAEIKAARADKKSGRFFGWLLVALGLAFLLKDFVPHWFAYQIFSFWPVAIVAVGLYLVMRKN